MAAAHGRDGRRLAQAQTPLDGPDGGVKRCDARNAANDLRWPVCFDGRGGETSLESRRRGMGDLPGPPCPVCS